MWKTTSDILDRLFKKINGPIKDKIEEAWKGIGEDSEKAKIIVFKNGQLTISVKNSSYLQEFSFKREEIKEKLNKVLKDKVKEIRLTLGS